MSMAKAIRCGREGVKDHQGNSIVKIQCKFIFDLAAHLLWVIRITFINLTL